MASVTMKFKCDNGSKNIHELASTLRRELDAQVVYETYRDLRSAAVLLLSFERYYLRNNSYTSLTIMIIETGMVQTVDIISSGGDIGIFNTNKSFAEKAADFFRKYGYQEMN